MLISRCVIIAWKISTEIIWTESDRCKEIRTPHIRQKSILSNTNLEDCYFVWILISISRVYVSVICNIMFVSLWIIYNELFNYNLTNITYRFTRYMKKYSCTFEANMNFYPTYQIIHRKQNYQVQHDTKSLMVLFIHYSF